MIRRPLLWKPTYTPNTQFLNGSRVELAIEILHHRVLKMILEGFFDLVSFFFYFGSSYSHIPGIRRRSPQEKIVVTSCENKQQFMRAKQ